MGSLWLRRQAGYGEEPGNLAAMFGEKSKVVIAWLLGALPDGKVRVMRPGGKADITGALAAAAIDAGVY